ncbi:hypothetical protein ACFU9W_46755 [Streptomyces sp. NPDC057600]|uniref:hypothetical protein n=1 Tax=Streptomyces sp. NPDC057600 TaxID=3346180 RepID=UPI0036995D1E
MTTLHDAVHRAQRAGRVLEVFRPSYARLDPQGYDRALAELALPGTIDEAGQTAVEPALQDDTESSDAAGTSPFTDGVRLYVPGAHVVPTKQLGAVTEAIAHTITACRVVCVYGGRTTPRPRR